MHTHTTCSILCTLTRPLPPPQLLLSQNLSFRRLHRLSNLHRRFIITKRPNARCPERHRDDTSKNDVVGVLYDGGDEKTTVNAWRRTRDHVTDVKTWKKGAEETPPETEGRKRTRRAEAARPENNGLQSASCTMRVLRYWDVCAKGGDA